MSGGLVDFRDDIVTTYKLTGILQFSKTFPEVFCKDIIGKGL